MIMRFIIHDDFWQHSRPSSHLTLPIIERN